MKVITTYLPLADYFEFYLSRKKGILDQTRNRLERLFRLYIQERIGRKSIPEIRFSDYLLIRSGMKKSGKGRATISETLSLLRNVLQEAKEEGFPVDEGCLYKPGTFTFPIEQRHYVHYSDPELEQFEKCDIHRMIYKSLLIAAKTTGLTEKELIGIREEDFDPGQRTLTVCRQVTREGMKEYQRGIPPYRVIPLSDPAYQLFLDLDQAESKRRNVLFMGNPNYNPGHYLFMDASGLPFLPAMFKWARVSAQKDSGIRDLSIRGMSNQFSVDVMDSGTNPVTLRDYTGKKSMVGALRAWLHKDEYRRK